MIKLPKTEYLKRANLPQKIKKIPLRRLLFEKTFRQIILFHEMGMKK